MFASRPNRAKIEDTANFFSCAWITQPMNLKRLFLAASVASAASADDLTCSALKQLYKDSDIVGGGTGCCANPDGTLATPETCVGERSVTDAIKYKGDNKLRVNSPFYDDAQATMDDILDKLTTENVGYEGMYKPAAMLIASQHGEAIYAADGVADFSTNEAFTVDTPLSIYSAGKAIGGLMTAMAISRGYIESVTQPLRELFPGFDKSLKQVIPISNTKAADLGLDLETLKDGQKRTLASGDEIQMLNPSAELPELAYPNASACSSGETPVLFEHTEGGWGAENWYGVMVNGTIVAEAGCDLEEGYCKAWFNPDGPKNYLGATYGPDAASGAPGTGVYAQTVCIPDGASFTVMARDSYGDGWNGGFLNVRTTEALGGRISCALPGIGHTTPGKAKVEIASFDLSNLETCPPLQPPYAIAVFAETRQPTFQDLMMEGMAGMNSHWNAPGNTISQGWENAFYKQYMKQQSIPSGMTSEAPWNVEAKAGVAMNKMEMLESMYANWTGLVYLETGSYHYGSGSSVFEGTLLEYIINKKDGTNLPLDELYNAWFAELGLDVKLFFYGKNDLDENFRATAATRAKQWGQPLTQYHTNDATEILKLARKNMSDVTSDALEWADKGNTQNNMANKHDKYDPDGFPGIGAYIHASTRSLAHLYTAIANGGTVNGVELCTTDAHYQVFGMPNDGMRFGYGGPNEAYGNDRVLDNEWQAGPKGLAEKQQFAGGIWGLKPGAAMTSADFATATSVMSNALHDLKPYGVQSAKIWGGYSGIALRFYDDTTFVGRYAPSISLTSESYPGGAWMGEDLYMKRVIKRSKLPNIKDKDKYLGLTAWN